MEAVHLPQWNGLRAYYNACLGSFWHLRQQAELRINTGGSDKEALKSQRSAVRKFANSVRTNGPTICPLVWLPYVPKSVEIQDPSSIVRA